MIRARNDTIPNTATMSHRTRFTTALKQCHRMRTAQRMMRKRELPITANVVVLLYAIIFNFLCGSRTRSAVPCEPISNRESFVFFCVFLSPFVCSYDFSKGSRIGFAKFFRRNTTPLRVWRFPRNPSGLETLPFQFAFYLCRRNNQTSGDWKTSESSRRDSFAWATRTPFAKRTDFWADYDIRWGE